LTPQIAKTQGYKSTKGEEPSSTLKALKTTRYQEDGQQFTRVCPYPLWVISP